MYAARIRIIYPLARGRMVLRTDQDWERDVVATSADPSGSSFVFDVRSEQSYLEFKPCIVDGPSVFWSSGPNKLMPLTVAERDFYPDFFSGVRGRVTAAARFSTDVPGKLVSVRVYLPAGYDENTLKRYPVLYMHDGTNLFFPEEAFMGREWQVDETLELLDSMNIIDQIVVVGIHTPARQSDYTAPGYREFGRQVTGEIKPWVDDRFRTLAGREHTGVMGSSLGGVVSFFLGWEYPHLFGTAACLSSTFWYQNDLLQRVRAESPASRLDTRFYLDSGWPRDNFEVTFAMAAALIEAGFVLGRNVVHFSFPLAQHNETAWAARSHLPIQLFSGKLRRLQPGRLLQAPEAVPTSSVGSRFSTGSP